MRCPSSAVSLRMLDLELGMRVVLDGWDVASVRERARTAASKFEPHYGGAPQMGFIESLGRARPEPLPCRDDGLVFSTLLA